METEKGKVNFEQLSSERLDFIKEHGLDDNTLNNWGSLANVLNEPEKWYLLSEPKFYEDYVRHTSVGQEDLILEMSDKDKIAKHDELVKTFRENQDKIKNEKNLKLLEAFYDEAYKLVMGK